MKSCNSAANVSMCNCSYSHCDKKGICCECIKYHKRLGELPACFFPNDVERTYDRSIKKFVEIHAHLIKR
ncbi:MAG TPA: hypothetical protein DEH02_14865 [Bacteroidales bacterium]|nr:hypothetical protein [Bacteroidales bacterium]